MKHIQTVVVAYVDVYGEVDLVVRDVVVAVMYVSYDVTAAQLLQLLVMRQFVHLLQVSLKRRHDYLQ